MKRPSPRRADRALGRCLAWEKPAYRRISPALCFSQIKAGVSRTVLCFQHLLCLFAVGTHRLLIRRALAETRPRLLLQLQHLGRFRTKPEQLVVLWAVLLHPFDRLVEL